MSCSFNPLRGELFSGKYIPIFLGLAVDLVLPEYSGTSTTSGARRRSYAMAGQFILKFYVVVITHPFTELNVCEASRYSYKMPMGPLLLTWIDFDPSMDK